MRLYNAGKYSQELIKPSYALDGVQEDRANLPMIDGICMPRASARVLLRSSGYSRFQESCERNDKVALLARAHRQRLSQSTYRKNKHEWSERFLAFFFPSSTIRRPMCSRFR